MKNSLLEIRFTYLSFIIISFLLLTGCAAEKRVMRLDRVQTQYNNSVSLNEHYLNGDYGQPDPASFERLKQYRYEAYQALMQFRQQFDKNSPLPQTSLQNTQLKIDQYVSYLNALGATSATKNTLTGF